MEAVVKEGGFPRRITGDHGSENGLVARIQREVFDDERSFRYGKSTSNQRIERWWGYLRISRSDYWIHNFKLLPESDLFLKEDPMQTMCLQYAFLPFIQTQLDETRCLWNSHSIRHQRNGDVVSGIPDILHKQTEIYGVQNFLTMMPDNVTQQYADVCVNNFLDLDQDFCNVVLEISNSIGLPYPTDIITFEDERALYIVLKDLFNL